MYCSSAGTDMLNDVVRGVNVFSPFCIVILRAICIRRMDIFFYEELTVKVLG